MYYDPDTHIPFYIGKGCDNRYRDVGSRFYNKHLYNKIQKIRKTKNCKVIDFTKFLLINLTNEEALRHEIRLIEEIGRSHLNKGPLLNLTEGGDGVVNPYNKISSIIKDKSTFQKLVSEKKTTKQVAEYYNCSTSTISIAAKKLGIKFIKFKKDLPELKLVEQYNKEKSVDSLSFKYNCDRDVIIRILKLHNVSICDGRTNSIFRGGKGKSKVQDNAEKIIKLYNENNSIKSIARTFHVSPRAIFGILTQHNITPTSKTNRIKKFTNEILQMHNNSVSVKIIASTFNVSIHIIQQILKQNRGVFK